MPHSSHVMLSSVIRRLAGSAWKSESATSTLCLTSKYQTRHETQATDLRNRRDKEADKDKDFIHNYLRGENDNNIGRVVSLSPGKVKAFRKFIPKTENEEDTETHDEVDSLEGVPRFTKLGDDTTDLRKVMLNVKSAKMREKSNQILLEGKRLIQDALKAGAKPLMIFFSRPMDIKNLQVADGVPVYKVLYKNLQLWSDVVTCQGVIGVFEMPEDAIRHADSKSVPLTIVCDNIRDPGNMGAILRTAAGVGVSNVILTKGCVDIWDPKVLRSGAGAHFRLCILKSRTWQEIAEVVDKDSLVCLADGGAAAISPYTAAASSSLPLMAYHASYLNAGATEATLVVGGETEGVSSEAFQFAESRGAKARRVYIPMSNGVDSLNAGTALGIVAYEIRRQLTGEGSSGANPNTPPSSPQPYHTVGLYNE